MSVLWRDWSLGSQLLMKTSRASPAEWAHLMITSHLPSSYPQLIWLCSQSGPKQLSLLGHSNFSSTLKGEPQEPATLYTVLTPALSLILISNSLALCAFHVSLWLSVVLETECQAVNLCSGQHNISLVRLSRRLKKLI